MDKRVKYAPLFRRVRLRNIAALWAVVAVVIVLLFAAYRLGHQALIALDMPMSYLQWFLLCLNVIFMAYSEGYKGFQRSFSPRFAARVRYIRKEATFIEMLLAPVFCFGYFGSTNKRLISTYVLTAMIMIMVLFVRQLPQPWRGIVDAGVVIGLLWGSVSLIAFVVKALTDEKYPYSPELRGSS